jgi:D-3-phosphoglycerate dehydrogenase
MNLVISEAANFNPKALQRLRSMAEVVIDNFDRQSLLNAIADVDILWVRLRNYVDNEVMDAAPNMKIIVTPTTGLTHIEVAEAEKRNIRILSLFDDNEFLSDVRATAEHTIALTLALLRHIPQSVNHVLSSNWNRDLFIGHEIYGKSVGIIGYGRLGRIVANYFSALGARVLAFDPNLQDSEFEESVVPTTMEDLLHTAEIISLHANVTTNNVGLIDKHAFSAMKNGTYFINTARGELVDHAALLSALRSGKLGGAAVDVLPDEPNIDLEINPLLAHAREYSNLIITPHLGGCTMESLGKVEMHMVEKLSRTLAEHHIVGS